ncbi:lysylphosphatidylglycerol synthase transmembrane domain-containing protein [Streptacidiphilus albus]|uniref:lysylphosphatidylglycerol synthase transmembrane domain-containing protein n=1 Tax=Streptacidiphilus albus TaxID=105425 RepID=UPI00054C55C0|nr:lysylphosphatidylglycerol synthase transmembrane domain-containing protein [Streptacidiphilus albus]
MKRQGAVVEPGELLLSPRARRPEALIRCLLGLVLVGAVLFLADNARSTAGGLNADAEHQAERLPRLLLEIAGSFTTLAVLLLPVAFGLLLVLQGDRRRAADGVLAAVPAYGLALAVAPTHPVLGYTAPVVAYLVTAGVAERLRWLAVLTGLLILGGLTALADHRSDVLSLLLAPLIGWTVANGTAYALGSPNARLTTGTLCAALRQTGLLPVEVVRTPGIPAHEPHRYLVRQQGDRPDLDVMLLDREASSSGFFRRAWRHLRLRTAPQRRSLLSPRGALQQEALLCYAAQAAGVRTRRLIVTADLGPDAAIAVYEPLGGRTLDLLADEELTDELLTDVWQQLALLHTRRIAHRALVPAAVLVVPDAEGRPRVHLVDLEDGDIAAGDLTLRIDLAQLLTTTALRVGPERAVAAAFAVLGPDRVGSAVALLQPLALNRATRADREQLAAIRGEILRTRPESPVEPVRLERLRPRVWVSALGGAVAGYYLLLQLSSRSGDPFTVLAAAQGGWIALAALASVLGFVAAAMSFVGFVPESLSSARVLLVQLAGAFVNVVTPSGVGGMAIGARFLQKAGIAPRKAIASVGAAQVVGLVLHLLLIMVFGYLASVHYGTSLSISPALITGLLVAAVLALIAAGVPPLRRLAAARLQPLFSDVVPRLLDMLQHPGRLAVGVVGQLLISLVSAACLDCCLRAFGLHPGFAAVAVANLVGGALGSAVPTPGGVGPVEALLSGALVQTTGISYAEAFTSVLLFRVLTFWLPLLPGWLSFLWLQRREAL